MATVLTKSPLVATNELPAIRRIGLADLRDVLAHGVDDFLAIPTQLVFLCLIYPVVGLLAARVAIGGDLLPLLYPLVAGITLLGPVLAVGVYELSRRREAGQPVSSIDAFAVLRAPSFFAVALLGIMLLAVFIAWLAVAKGLYAATLGAGQPADQPLAAGVFAERLIDLPAGWTLIVVGNAVGLLFALLVLTMTAISVPMLIDRPVSPFTAMHTSMRAVAANPLVMATWGLLVAGLLLLGCVPLFIGLAVVMPILGHATWHLYRKLVV